MEEETKVSPEVPLVKVVDGEMPKEDKVMEKEEEEDTTFDSGFVKVEKEGMDTKYAPIEDQKQVSIERSSSGSHRELHESQEKVKELELELEKVTGELKRYESENTLLKDEFSSTKGRLEETEKKHEEVKKKLQEQISEGEARHSSQLKSLEDALQLHDVKHKELSEAKEAFDGLGLELENSRKKTMELEERLRLSALEAEKFEEKLKISDENFSKTDALLSQALSQNSVLEQKLKDLEALQVKNSSLEAALSAAMEKERELSENLNAVMEKLKFAEERLEKQAREIDEATTRSIELEALHKHSELRIQKAMEDFSSRDAEAKSLTEKSKDLEERIRLYEGKLAEASGQSLSLQEELDQSSAENELLADTNNQLKMKIQELEGYLDSEKETANERLNQRDTEAKDLITKLKSHENLIEEHKRQFLEASGVADTRKVELEVALSKLKTLESTVEELEKENGDLAEVNIKLNQKLANHGSETGDFQAKLSALEAEKDQTAKELQTAIEDLTKQLTSEGERLRSQISSLEEENNQVNEIYQSTKNELVKLQEQLQEDQSKSDAMVSEIKKLSTVAAEKSVLESNFEQMEKQLKEVEAQLKEEVEKVAELTSKLQEHEHKASERAVLDEQANQLHKELQTSHSVISEEKEAVSQKHSELEATLTKSQEELEAKKSIIVHLESLLKDLEQKVKLADAKSKETESRGKGEVEVKSRDVDLSFSTPTQRNNKKKSDVSSSSSGNITIQKAETSHLMTLKIVLGVALVSVIIGIILGKKY